MKIFLQWFTHFQNRPFFISRSPLRKFFRKTNPGFISENTLPLNGTESGPQEGTFKTPFVDHVSLLAKNMLRLPEYIKSIGFTDSMDEYSRRKLGIFNLLNFFQLITGLIVPVSGALMDDQLTAFSWYISALPTFISILVLALNLARQYDLALVCYFLLYPVFTSIVYMGGMNLGTELYFILYGILSVFFIQEISNMLFSVMLSMISYFTLSVIWNDYRYQLHSENIFLYILNQVIAILFIFYGLFLIKRENSNYQSHILAKNSILQNRNEEIRKQKREIAEKAILLKRQASELSELNTLKNKLFSVIAHDLKTPIYGLQTLFRSMQQYNIPAEEIKKLIPDVVNDLNYTTGLMENLLQWAKSQMQHNSVNIQALDALRIARDVVKLLRIQAEAKNITVEIRIQEGLTVLGDKDMIHLVLRNLLSNAIKFTAVNGHIIVGAENKTSEARLYVQDNGIGMNSAALQKLNENDYYTTKGTASESGTGLGLMLCREFIAKNGSNLHIKSTPMQGSTFSFTLKLDENGHHSI